MTRTTVQGRSRLAKVPSAYSSAMVDAELVLIDLKTGKFSSLAGSGLRIWELLDTTDDLASVCGMLRSEYEVDGAQCEEEVAEFADQLVEAGFARYV